MSWKEAGFVIASKTRRAIVMKLDTPMTPTYLAKSLDVNLANISRTLTELENKGIAVCLNPRQKVGKIYSLTKKEKMLLTKIQKMES
jgi:predicted transcriptional regulator